ncbi:MAG TPA: hypothetical protein VF366_07415 [Dehalococcoidia bacterium]
MKILISLVLLAVVLIPGCTCQPIIVGGKQPVINSFNASPASISSGESSSLDWEVSGATSVSIDQGIGNVALTGSRAVAPAATTVYTLTASSTGGSVTATTQVIVSGTAPPPPTPPSPPTGLPVINYFTISPSSVSFGSSVIMSWDVTNATAVTIDNGIGVMPVSGSTTIMLVADTIFTLTATNAVGSTMRTASVVVSSLSPPPGILPVVSYFQAAPPIITSGGSTMLSWSVTNATSVVIDNGVGSVAASGSALVSPVSSTDYTLMATNAYGYITQTLSVLVTGGGPTVAYDFVENAATAEWWTKIGSTITPLPFPGPISDKGYANYQYNIKLNDGNTYTRVLQTHPQWVDNGWISGKYSGVYVPPGSKLRIKVGLIQNASAGNVIFNIGKLGDVATINTNVWYAGGVKVLESDLSAYAGQTIDFVLNVNANGSSGQDWAAWAEAKIIY